MFQKLNQPLWPQSKLSLTTPMSLLLAGASMVVGVWLYVRGFPYEGSAIAYMLGGVVFAWPYYSARFTFYMTWLVMMCFVPMSIWLQNKAVEVDAWSYRPHEGYLVWFTKAGEGWWRWSRHLWLGNDMPAMEYVFYPLFGLFQMTLYSLFSHLLPDDWFEQPHRHLRWVFPVVFLPLTAGFAWIYFKYPKPGVTDYIYWLTWVGFVVTGGAYAVSRNYRAYSRAPAYWIWAVGMGVIFMPPWEFFHSCFNRDWVYNPAQTFPALISWRGAGIPLSEFFGYITTATTFQALMLLFILKFGKVVIKNYELVPFSRR